MKYFGHSHAAYAIITMLIVFILLVMPVVVLLLYPCRWFQKCLNHFHLRSLALQAFVDVFQGCYKDGTNGTRDCRYFVPLLIFIRLVCAIIFSITRNGSVFAFYTALILMFLLVLCTFAQTYKDDVYNKTDIVLLIIVLCNVVIFMYSSIQVDFPALISNVCPIVVRLIIGGYMCYHTTKHVILYYRRQKVYTHLLA